MLPEKQKEAFNNFYSAITDNGVLDKKTSAMIGAAAAMATGCYPCMKTYFAKAEAEGVTEEELGAVRGIVMGISAGKVLAQSSEVMSKK